MKASLFNDCFNLLLPQNCYVCQKQLKNNLLCSGCRELINFYPFKPDQNYFAIFYYEMLIKKFLVGTKKFHSFSHLNILLRECELSLASSHLITTLKTFSPDAIVFIPNDCLRDLYRPFCLTLLFAKIISKQINAPTIDALHKKISFKRQKFLNKQERKKAIKGSFTLKRDLTKFKRILLVDDIVTTGSTFDECKKILSSRERIIKCLAIAKTA